MPMVVAIEMTPQTHRMALIVDSAGFAFFFSDLETLEDRALASAVIAPSSLDGPGPVPESGTGPRYWFVLTVVQADQKPAASEIFWAASRSRSIGAGKYPTSPMTSFTLLR